VLLVVFLVFNGLYEVVAEHKLKEELYVLHLACFGFEVVVKTPCVVLSNSKPSFDVVSLPKN
jgi:hypothetical protein